MKKGMNKGSAKRVVIILSLCLALLIALGAFSFAWIRNYVDVDTVQVTTGKMLYNFKLYRVKNGVVTPITFFDTEKASDSEAGNSSARLEKDLGTTAPLINIDDGEEVFFVIEKYSDSIDFDVAISFDNDGRPENFEYIGQMNYMMGDDSSSIASVNSQAALEAYLKAPNENTAKVENLGNIWNVVQKTSLEGNQKYALVRLKLARNASSSADVEGASFPFRVSFCVAQKDALPDDTQVDKFYVKDETTLEEAMQSYGFGDEIYFVQDVDYAGDLVFTRPCTVTLVRSTLTLKGNLVFSYMYGGKFVLNTVSDGHIIIGKNNDADGNFQIDLPDTSIELVGANNDAAGMADIYVEGRFTANASKNDGEGLFFKGVRICNTKTVSESEFAHSTDLKPVLINGSTRMSIANRTRVGALTANFYCRKFVLDNQGYIEGIDLTSMTQDITLLSTPCILIDNAGSVGVVDTDSNVIKLPKWSVKFNANDKKSAEDNTHIIANKGSGKILAITPNNSYDEDASIVNSGSFFFSKGDKEENGYRDDIDYMLRTQFVEAVDGDKTKIIVHYEAPAQIILNEEQYKDLAGLTTLKSYIDYYSANGDIAEAKDLKEVTVICYGDKALTAPPLKNPDRPDQGYAVDLEYDYNFIKSMSELTKLDLSDAVSVEKKVPDNAFKGMSNLTSVQMSESDTTWGKYIFTGTAIDEITFPQSLTTLNNTRDNKGNATKQEVLDGIRYVYTAITIVDGVYANKYAVQYYFVPDDFAYDEYRKLNNVTEWHARIFLNNGVRRYGEYFLRYDPDTQDLVPTCEFVVYTGGVTLDNSGKEVRKAWVKEEEFDFNKMYIDGNAYTITSFDPYALFNKLYCEESLEVVLSESVTSIGKYAFACGSDINAFIGLTSITIEGNPEILGNAFAYNDALVSFNAPKLTKLKGGYNLSNNNVLKKVYMPSLGVVEGTADLGSCPELESVDIGVIERTDDNKNFYIAIAYDSGGKIYNNTTSYDKYSYAKFYIHTEYANDVSSYSKALAADYRHIFVTENYADLYRATATYEGVTEIGDNSLDALIAADIDGNDLVAGKQHAYYYVIDGSNARLVACLLSKIDEKGKDYTTISSFNHNGVEYPVSYIGAAAYHFTKMFAQNIKISDGVTALGDYSFDSFKDGYKKYCVTLDLNNVAKAGKRTFYYMDMARIVGDSLEEVGEDALSYNQNLIVANLPNLVRTRPAGSTVSKTRVFVACKNLRLICIGYSDDIDYDKSSSLRKNYIRFVNFVDGSQNIELPNVNTIINSSYPIINSNFQNSFIKVDKSYNGIYVSDYYDYEIKLGEITDTLRLPGYIYHKQDNGELSLIAVSPDLQSFGDYKINENGGSDYTTPGKLYEVNGEYTAKDNGSTPEFTVTSIGKHAYGAVIVDGVDNFIIAGTVKKLDNGALSGSAYENSFTSTVTLTGVKCLDLANVTEIGRRACYISNIEQLKAPNTVVFGEEAFADCKSLLNAYLPSFERALVSGTFKNCSDLLWVTFGENATTLVNNMFEGAKNLQKITILNTKQVVNPATSLRSSEPEKIFVAVPAAIYKAYETAFKTSKFAGIPFANFTYFGNAFQINGATYYWNELDGSAKTAYIDYVEGTLPDTLIFPSKFDGYKVVAVSANAISALPDNVSKIVLPDNMEYLTFNTADLTSGIMELEISSSNSKFKTVSGVLYSKDGKTLYVYPQSKSGTTFTVDSTVIEIAYRAFYGAKNIETLTIAGVVTVRDQAFEKAGISTIKFTNTTASVFAGKDILLGANAALVISVPKGSLIAFKSKVLMDYSILDRFVGA